MVYPTLGGRIANIVTIITAIIAAGELFVLNLSHNFYWADGPKQILDKLDEYVKVNKEMFDRKDYSGIVAYLEWLEELAVY